MNFQIKYGDILKQKTDCLVLTIREGKNQSDLIKAVDSVTNNMIANLIKSGDFKGKPGESLTLYHVPQLAAKKVLLIGAGDKKEDAITHCKTIAKTIADKLISLNSKSILLALTNVQQSNIYKCIRTYIETIHFHRYHFDEYQTTKAPNCITKMIVFGITEKTLSEQAELAILHAQAIANAVNATRTLANQPSNICNAQFLADKAKWLSKQYPKLKPTFYNEKALAKLNMNAYLAVGRGSENESIMTVIEYHGAKSANVAPFVLVGKGLTFDSGGISIKPAAGMDEMKYDMCGAATVYGVMQAIAELNLPINVVGVMAGCENMPDGNAYRPGDILTTMSGQTVEIINTDAEGRLVLCDVLTFVERFKPKAVIDIATLTGACIIALGHHYTGVIGNDDELVAQLIQASNEACDKAWQLPMDDNFQQQIKSTCADIVNAAGRDGGTITAGCFLSRFTKNYHWAHLDIAGTAWTSGAKKGATGRPVAMLVQYLMDQSR